MRVVKISGPPQSIVQSDIRDYLLRVAEVINKSGDAIANVGIVTTETAGAAYTATEKDMLNHLKADVNSIAVTLNTLLAELRTIKTLDV